MFARELGGKLYCIHYLKFQSPLHAPIKYVLQSLRTLKVLFHERPTAVHVQNPPFVCGLVVYLYCKLTGGCFVTEHHSAAFDRAWEWASPIQRYVARRAVVNLVTSAHWAAIMDSWGAKALVMHDPFLDLPQGEPYRLKDGFNVAFVSTFASDEPAKEVVSAAALVPDVNFYITGDPRKARDDIRVNAGSNITFTGFLDMNRDYLGLLRGVDAVMVLTTRDHTLQLAGCEAIAVGRPLITSDWQYLRGLFGAGTLFVSHTAESIAAGVREMRDRHEELEEEIIGFRRERRRDWDERLSHLQSLVAAALKEGGRTQQGQRHGPNEVPLDTTLRERASR
jgi:glycosyltransferase involved in cell wall biosynthesis